MVGLEGLGHRYPHQLSGGQQQRVALARALAVQPRLVLLDEPFAALDASLRASVREDVQAILARAGTTAILVTHDQDEALSIADLVAVIRDGRIAQVRRAAAAVRIAGGRRAGRVHRRGQRHGRHRTRGPRRDAARACSRCAAGSTRRFGERDDRPGAAGAGLGVPLRGRPGRGGQGRAHRLSRSRFDHRDRHRVGRAAGADHLAGAGRARAERPVRRSGSTSAGRSTPGRRVPDRGTPQIPWSPSRADAVAGPAPRALRPRRAPACRSR